MAKAKESAAEIMRKKQAAGPSTPPHDKDTQIPHIPSRFPEY